MADDYDVKVCWSRHLLTAQKLNINLLASEWKPKLARIWSQDYPEADSSISLPVDCHFTEAAPPIHAV